MLRAMEIRQFSLCSKVSGNRPWRLGFVLAVVRTMTGVQYRADPIGVLGAPYCPVRRLARNVCVRDNTSGGSLIRRTSARMRNHARK